MIYKPERLGDFLLAANAIRGLADHWGERHTALIVSPECRDLAGRTFPGLTTFSLPLRLDLDGWNVGQARALRGDLSRWSCEHLVCLRHHRQPLSSAALRWIPAARRWGTTSHPWMHPGILEIEDGLFDDPLPYPWPGTPGLPAEVQAHARLVEHITGTPADVAELLPRILISRPAPDPGEPPLLAVVPWGSGKINTLTGELIAAVVRHLPRGACRVRIVAEARRRREQARLAGLLSDALWGTDVAEAPTQDLEELYQTIAGADAVLSADTFPAHVATAMDKPTAVLATGALRGVFGPWSHSHRQRWFCRVMDCWGCGWRCDYPAPRCLLDVATEDVAEFLAPYLLSRSPADASSRNP
ncbi:MAG TPA: glycosyltransferase family 9 protein [Longimicrobiales bacterium]|nr:glycosyltransferase family 9 protein [Longimicrobiales bacterium]